MEQTITPNPNMSCTPGYCLVYVRETFDITSSGNYPTAYSNWEASPSKHTDQNWPELWFPIWFAVNGNPAGHVALHAPDHSIYSSSSPTSSTPVHHSSLTTMQQYWNNGTMLNYLGWTENIEDTQVIKQGVTEDMVDENYLNAFYIDLCNRGPSDSEKTLYIGRPFTEVYNEIRNGEEHQNIVAKDASQADVITGLENERDNVNYPKINAATSNLKLPSDASADQIASAIQALEVVKTEPVIVEPSIPIAINPIPTIHATPTNPPTIWTWLSNFLKGFFK